MHTSVSWGIFPGREKEWLQACLLACLKHILMLGRAKEMSFVVFCKESVYLDSTGALTRNMEHELSIKLLCFARQKEGVWELFKQ